MGHSMGPPVVVASHSIASYLIMSYREAQLERVKKDLQSAAAKEVKVRVRAH